MSSFKSIAVIGLLGVLGAAVYFKMNNGPEPEPPPEFSGTWGEPPTIEMPIGGSPGGDLAGETGPQIALPTPESDGLPVPAVPPASASGPPAAMTAGGTVPPPVAVGGEAGPRVSVSPAPAGAPPWPGQQRPAKSGAAPASPARARAGILPATISPDTHPTNTPRGRPASEPPRAAAATNTSNVTYATTRRAAQKALDRGALAEALLLLSPWYGDPSLAPSDQTELANLLSQLAGTVIYSTDSYIEPPHVVRADETLQTIADQYQVPWQLLARINGLNESDRLKPGDKIKVVRGPFSAVVNLATREMVLRVGGYYAGRFHVGVGTERQDMAGHWVVKHKVINPTYYGRDRVIDANDPSNPLGEYWLGLANEAQQRTVEPLGIHGACDAKSIDRNDPRGYIRLAPHDVEDVYDILSIGSRVVIRR